MNEQQVNFQINHFSLEKKDIFKKWCHKNRLSMRSMQYLIVENIDKFQPIIEKLLKEQEQSM